MRITASSFVIGQSNGPLAAHYELAQFWGNGQLAHQLNPPIACSIHSFLAVRDSFQETFLGENRRVPSVQRKTPEFLKSPRCCVRYTVSSSFNLRKMCFGQSPVPKTYTNRPRQGEGSTDSPRDLQACEVSPLETDLLESGPSRDEDIESSDHLDRANRRPWLNCKWSSKRIRFKG